MINQNFNLTSLIVLIAVLFTGIGFIYFFSWKEARRLKKIESERYPSATRHSSAVDNKLQMDITESFYN
jgi:hypothetical protein